MHPWLVNILTLVVWFPSLDEDRGNLKHLWESGAAEIPYFDRCGNNRQNVSRLSITNFDERREYGSQCTDYRC